MQKKYTFTYIVSLFILIAIPLVVSAQGGQGRNGNGNGAGTSAQQQFNNQTGVTNSQSQYTFNGRGNSGNQQVLCGSGLCMNLPAAVDTELSDDVIQAMTNGIMDEYHAYNTYQQVIDQFGAARPFVNIQRAEAQHISAWEMLFNRYGVNIPEAPTIDDSLVFDSISDACSAAADAEIANFGLYDDMLNILADYPDMVQIVTNLRNVSEFNHLVAFEHCVG